jgi:glycosyltransferase involved in cell wall biosynthesis
MMISVIIPAFNEEAYLPETLGRIGGGLYAI